MKRDKMGYTQPDEYEGNAYITLQEGPNLLRLVAGPVVRYTYWYPSFKANEEGIFKEQRHGIMCDPRNKSVISSLYAEEWNLMKEAGIENPENVNCLISRDKKYVYLAFDLREDIPVMRPVYLPTSVHKRFDIKKNPSNNFITETYVDKPQFLRNGLLFMFDINVVKTIEKGKTARYGTGYTVDVYKRYAPDYSLPISLLQEDTNWLEVLKGVDESFGWETFFTPEQLEAIDACEQEPETAAVNKSNDEVVAELKSFPILFQDQDTHFNALGMGDVLKQLNAPATDHLPESGDEIVPEGDAADATTDFLEDAEEIPFEDAPETSEEDVTSEETASTEETSGDDLPSFLSDDEK